MKIELKQNIITVQSKTRFFARVKPKFQDSMDDKFSKLYKKIYNNDDSDFIQ